MSELTRRNLITAGAALGVTAGAASLISSSAWADEAPATSTNQEPTWNIDADVVVVGGGGAGVCAAIEAAQAGCSVIVLEKNDFPGGDTVRSGGMIMAGGTEVQAGLGIEDSVENFVKTEVGHSAATADLDMVREMCEKSPEQVELMQKLGRDFNTVSSMKPVATYDGDYSAWAPRTHHDVDGRTGHFVLLMDYAEELGVRFVNKAQADHLTRNAAGEVTGVIDTDGKAYRANKGVVLASASFDNNLEMSQRYHPMNAWVLGYERDIHPSSVQQCPTNTGDGIRMAQELGADLRLNPSGCIVDVTYMSVTCDVSGSILVNDNGDRFTQENACWGYLNQCVYNEAMRRGNTDTTQPHFWIVCDQATCDAPGSVFLQLALAGQTVSVTPGYLDLIRSADTIEELADLIGVPADRLSATVDRWNGFAQAGLDEDFGRRPVWDSDDMGTIEEGPFYAFPFIPFSMGSFGGLRTDAETQVIDVNGNPIPRLYAAGAIMSGMYTAPFYNSCGWSILGTMVWGRKAGVNVAALDSWTDEAVADTLEEEDLSALAEQGVASASGSYTAGDYEAAEPGHSGDVPVRVTFSDTAITAVTVGDNGESAGIGSWAVEWMPLKVLAAQSADVDAVSGATETSRAIMNAVEDCIAQASK